MVDARLLRRMKNTAVIVNVGRGNAIDEDALADALKRRRIAAAFLDVFKREPLTEDSPLAADLPGLFRLPHGSAFSPDYLKLFFRELAADGNLAE
jgi:phosphoglycerate dehydrogenase-like enzyme